MKITKLNGTQEEFDISKIEKVFNKANNDLDLNKYSFSLLAENIKTFIVEGISTIDINKIIIKSAVNLISIQSPKWELIAGRFAVMNLYKQCSKNTGIDVDNLYTPGYYRDLVKEMVRLGLYHKDLIEKYSINDLYKAGEYIKKETDFTYNLTTINMYSKRYLLNPNKKVRELPQHMYMSIALFLAMPEKEEDRLKFAFKIYDSCSTGEISLPTPTLLNARQPNCQLSSCFKISLDDDLRGIYHGIENMAQISKFGGGIGVYLGNIRSKGGSIRGVHGVSSGVMPFNKVINDTAIAVNQLGCVEKESYVKRLNKIKFTHSRLGEVEINQNILKPQKYEKNLRLQSISDDICDLGIKHKGISPNIINELLIKYSNGTHREELSKEYNISVYTIKRIITKLNKLNFIPSGYRELEDYNGYAINEYGDIISLNKGYQSLYKSKSYKGYIYGIIGNKSLSIHRLVYKTFGGNIPDGYSIDHIDNNKENNHISNLKILSHIDNINKKYDDLTEEECELINCNIRIKAFLNQGKKLNGYRTIDKEISSIEFIYENEKIYNIYKGDYVASFNGKNVIPNKVLNSYPCIITGDNQIRIHYEGGNYITTSLWHPLGLIEDGKLVYKRSDEVNIGDISINSEGKLLKIIKIDKVNLVDENYRDLEINNVNNYFCSSGKETGDYLLTHNSRAGAISVTLDVWHRDIFHFLDMQTETGDIRSKAFDLFPAVSFPDLFMRRVEENDKWTLFCPKEIYDITGKNLQDYWGEEFENFYIECEKNPNLKLKERIEAKELFKTYLKSTVETGMPYAFFRDTVNKLNPNKHTGIITHSNLCCVTGDTRIATEDGICKIEELYKEKELIPIKVTTDLRTEKLNTKEKGIVIRDSIGIYKTGILQTYKIETNAGYNIKATDYHKLYIKRNNDLLKLELKDVKIGDKLLIQSGKGIFGDKGNYEDGLIIGLMTGDGTFDGNTAIIELYNDDIYLKNKLLTYINSIISNEGKGGYQKICGHEIQHTSNSKKYRISSTRLGKYLNEKYNFNKNTKLAVPELVFKGNENFIRGYLQGLFMTDGTIGKQGKGIQIQLTSINKSLLSDIQILLSNFGIYSSIYNRNTEGNSTFSYTNKNGVYKKYINKASYRLDINGNNTKIFLEEKLIIGIKEKRLNEYILNHGEFNKKNFYATIINISKGEVEDVYDTTEAITNSVIFNGIVSGQCEIAQNTKPSNFIEEYSINTHKEGEEEIHIVHKPGDTVVCNLASINIAKVNTEDKIKEIMPIITRLLDNVITLNFYPVKEAEITSNKYRPIGIGFLGLAEYLAVNKISYNSGETKEIVEKMFSLFSQEGIKSSIELAKERGAYPLFKGSDWEKGIMFNGAYKEEIKKYGVRFGYMFAPAPNTSTALVVGTTPALLPIYKKYYTETGGTGISVTIAPNITEDNMWYYTEYTNTDLGQIIDIISTIQKYIDQSISFEWMINPSKVGPKDLYNYYFKAWKQGLKTVYYVRSMSLQIEECVSCSG